MDNKRSAILFKIIFSLLALIYIIVIIKMTFLKDGIRVSANKLYFIPFSGISEYADGTKSLSSLILNYIGNIAMFIPLGIFIPILFDRKVNLGKIILIGLFLSVLIEIFQYVFSSGYSDIDDIIMNTLGAVIGGFLYLYILGGKNKNISSYFLSLGVVLAFSVCTIYGMHKLMPNFLPDKYVVINDMIAGKKINEYSVRTECY